MINNGRPCFTTGSMALKIDWKLLISRSHNNTYGFSSTHSSFFSSVTKNLLDQPRSTFMPWMISEYVTGVFEFSTVTTRTWSYTSAIILPNSGSLFAEIVATSTRSVPFTGLAFFAKKEIESSKILLMCRMTFVLFIPGSIYLSAASRMAFVNTIDVVVPSPAATAVFLAASFTMLTARFSTGSYRLMFFAIDTPSLVITTPPTWFSDSISTVSPYGPSVDSTAPVSFLIPFLSFSCPELPK